MEHYANLAITDLEDFVFGRCPRPLLVGRGLTLGAGTVYPELNFTLPPMQITAATMGQVRQEYTQMIEQACARAVALQLPGLVVEFELLPDLTLQPEWGAEVTAILRRTLDKYEANHGLANALRVTPNDIREFERPPLLREGEKWDQMVSSFDLCAQAGADLLSIESTGGKELHDDALLNGDLAGSVFALGILASRDMGQLWDMIVAVASRRGGARRRRQRLRVRQHRHGPGRYPPYPQGVGGGSACHDRGPQPGGLRAMGGRTGEGLRL